MEFKAGDRVVLNRPYHKKGFYSMNKIYTLVEWSVSASDRDKHLMIPNDNSSLIEGVLSYDSSHKINGDFINGDAKGYFSLFNESSLKYPLFIIDDPVVRIKLDWGFK